MMELNLQAMAQLLYGDINAVKALEIKDEDDPMRAAMARKQGNILDRHVGIHDEVERLERKKALLELKIVGLQEKLSTLKAQYDEFIEQLYEGINGNRTQCD